MLRIPPWSRLDHHPPVIIIGMHRSGTSLVSQLLDMLGVFMGNDLDPNAESKHLRRLNKYSFRAVGADWNTPQPVIDAMQSHAFINEQALYFHQYLFTGWGGLRYWGVKQWAELIAGADMPRWGWKDPRTSLTLPAWLQIFPEAQVIHIIRNGIDVAISLHRRQLKQRTRFWGTHPDHYNPKGYDFRFCFELWEIYQKHLLTYRHTVPERQYTEITYEALLQKPDMILRGMLQHLQVPFEEATLGRTVATINKGRLDNRSYAMPYQDIIPELVTSSLMEELGYSNGQAPV